MKMIRNQLSLAHAPHLPSMTSNLILILSAVRVIVVKIVQFKNSTEVDLPIRYLSRHSNYLGD